MRLHLVAMLLPLVTACAPAESAREVPPVNGAALCAGTAAALTAHAAALGDLDPAEPRQARAILTGDALVGQVDAGCAR